MFANTKLFSLRYFLLKRTFASSTMSEDFLRFDGFIQNFALQERHFISKLLKYKGTVTKPSIRD